MKNSSMKFYRLDRPDPIVYGNKRVVGENLRVVGREISSMRRDVGDR